VAASIQIGHGFSIALDDLELIAINPDAAFKVTAARIDAFRRDVKQKRTPGLKLLLAYVVDVVIGQLVAGQDKRHAVADVVDVLLSDRNVAQSRAWRRYLLENTMTLVIEGDIEGFGIFTRGLAPEIEGLYSY